MGRVFRSPVAFYVTSYLAPDGIAAFRCLEDGPVSHGEKSLGALKNPQAQIRLGQEKVRGNHLDATVPEYLLAEYESLGAAAAKNIHDWDLEDIGWVSYRGVRLLFKEFTAVVVYMYTQST